MKFPDIILVIAMSYLVTPIVVGQSTTGGEKLQIPQARMEFGEIKHGSKQATLYTNDSRPLDQAVVTIRRELMMDGKLIMRIRSILQPNYHLLP